MNGLNDTYDKDFKILFQQTLEEDPPQGFTEKLMENIEESQFASTVPVKQNFSASLAWILMGAGFLIIGSGVLYYFQIQLFAENTSDILLPVFKRLESSFLIMFSNFSISPITLAVIVGIISLILIDKLLSYRNFKKDISSMLF